MTIIWVILGFYAAASLIFSVALLAAGVRRRNIPASPDPEWPFLSVVLPARNEAARLPVTLASLSAQDYPSDRFEVIVVDDRSGDRTAAIAAETGKGFVNFRVLRITEEPAVLCGKQNALHQGILTARGEFVVLTDADCRFDAGHLRAYAGAFRAGASLAFGRTAIAPIDSPIALLEAADLLFLFTVARAAAFLEFPLSCMGNNMAVLKRDYLTLGGYPALGPSVVEDCQLLSAFRKAKKPIRFVEWARPLVATMGVGSMFRFTAQRLRWSKSLLRFEPGLQALGIAAGAAGIFTLPLLVLAAVRGAPDLLQPVLLKTLADATLLFAGAAYFKARRLAVGFPLFWAWWCLAPFLLPAALLSPRAGRWKDS